MGGGGLPGLGACSGGGRVYQGYCARVEGGSSSARSMLCVRVEEGLPVLGACSVHCASLCAVLRSSLFAVSMCARRGWQRTLAPLAARVNQRSANVEVVCMHVCVSVCMYVSVRVSCIVWCCRWRGRIKL